MNKNVVIGLFFGLAMLVVGAIFAFTLLNETKSKNGFSSDFQRYESALTLAPFSLVTHKKEPFTEKELKGHWTLAFLGYTSCPDVCPLTLSALEDIYPQLVSALPNESVQILFVAVDPKRDTSERLFEYINYFNSEFIAVSAPHESLFPVVRNMRMMYALTEEQDKPYYFVDHSASITLIDPSARVIGRFKAQTVDGGPPVSNTQQILASLPRIVNGEL
ncbi:SCO family protein [Alteromonas sp. 5E99-2]|uniref:SCO family protein n=1 Tax=Alteromonas sp. 5E99-2 TaxID=2817683 RepID=UPI001A9A1ED5|nr:SCO family protein [Alteromonas sp. 5E99-2]MBO1254792.1 SCO family protein [Alteromonas sp. 5E99-2]